MYYSCVALEGAKPQLIHKRHHAVAVQAQLVQDVSHQREKYANIWKLYSCMFGNVESIFWSLANTAVQGRDINVDSVEQEPSSRPSICSGRCKPKPTLTLGGFITEVDTVSDLARRMEIWGVSENSIGDHPPPQPPNNPNLL